MHDRDGKVSQIRNVFDSDEDKNRAVDWTWNEMKWNEMKLKLNFAAFWNKFVKETQLAWLLLLNWNLILNFDKSLHCSR